MEALKETGVRLFTGLYLTYGITIIYFKVMKGILWEGEKYAIAVGKLTLPEETTDA